MVHLCFPNACTKESSLFQACRVAHSIPFFATQTKHLHELGHRLQIAGLQDKLPIHSKRIAKGQNRRERVLRQYINAWRNGWDCEVTLEYNPHYTHYSLLCDRFLCSTLFLQRNTLFLNAVPIHLQLSKVFTYPFSENSH